MHKVSLEILFLSFLFLCRGVINPDGNCFFASYFFVIAPLKFNSARRGEGG